jgi:hypothetical protein
MGDKISFLSEKLHLLHSASCILLSQMKVNTINNCNFFDLIISARDGPKNPSHTTAYSAPLFSGRLKNVQNSYSLFELSASDLICFVEQDSRFLYLSKK